MSNIKRTVERENLSAVFFCEFFYSKIQKAGIDQFSISGGR